MLVSDYRSERAKTVQPNYPEKSFPDKRTGPIWGNASGTALYRGSGRLFGPRPGRLERTCTNEGGEERLTAAASSILSPGEVGR
jgi:hypothetical protein